MRYYPALTRRAKIKTAVTPSAGEDVEKSHSWWNRKRYGHSGKSFLKNQTYPYYMTQLLYSWASIPEKRKLLFIKKLHRIVRGGFVLTAKD